MKALIEQLNKEAENGTDLQSFLEHHKVETLKNLCSDLKCKQGSNKRLCFRNIIGHYTSGESHDEDEDLGATTISWCEDETKYLVEARCAKDKELSRADRLDTSDIWDLIMKQMEACGVTQGWWRPRTKAQGQAKWNLCMFVGSVLLCMFARNSHLLIHMSPLQ